MAKHSAKVKTEDVATDAVSDSPEVDKKTLKLKIPKALHPHRLFSTKKRKIIGIIVGVVLVLGILFAIPFTRYFALGWIVKKDVTVTITDSTTKRPVSDAVVSLGGVTTKSDKNGVAKLRAVSVGQLTLKITKQYYTNSSQSYTVPVIFTPSSPSVALVATGRQVDVTVANKITGDPVDGVVVSASGTSATTSSDGTAVIILPASGNTQKATLTKSGYNLASVDINVNDVSAKNDFQVTPAGSIYYLSKATGTINVMKANLDGTGATVVVEGTGQESNTGTSLLSSRDWQYSALLATRTSDDQPTLYIINSSKDDFNVMDQGNASFQLIGWSGHNFIYLVTRSTTNVWDDKRQALKSYNADTQKVTTIDETTGTGTSSYGYAFQEINNVYILNSEVLYAKVWSVNGYDYQDTTRTMGIISSDTSGNKKTIRQFPQTYLSSQPYSTQYVSAYINAILYEPQSIYYKVITDANYGGTFYVYEDGTLKTADNMDDTKFDNQYPTYLVSPSGKKTLWYEPRDGKNAVFVGDQNGDNATQIGTLSDYTPYGWYGADDSYILLTKNGSELYIASANKVLDINGNTPLKITDYHKAQFYPGYGYGYGGQ